MIITEDIAVNDLGVMNMVDPEEDEYAVTRKRVLAFNVHDETGRVYEVFLAVEPDAFDSGYGQVSYEHALSSVKQLLVLTVNLA